MLTVLKQKISAELAKSIEKEEEKIFSLLEVPKSIDHGNLAMPVFFLAKELKKAPPKIAAEIADNLNSLKIEGVEKVEPVGGYLNFHFTDHFLQTLLLDSINKQEQGTLGFNQSGAGKKIVVDYSSPNVAKKMSIGHLRATVIGQSICNLAKTQGYEVTGLNYIGDWGSQFGKLAYAIDAWGDESILQDDSLAELTKIYIKFHDEAEKDPELNKKGAEYFKLLEEGDEKITSIWKQIINLSLKNYDKLYSKLGVEHKLVRGESYYNDKLTAVIEMLKEKQLLVESEGAMVVEMDNDKPPCLIQKADGASLYATRDIASAIDRRENLGADISLYVVGMDQTLHFQQVFEVLDKMNFSWSKDCHHISFGMYRFKDIGKMSTRKGTVIHFEDVLNKAIELVSELIEKKNPDLPGKDEVARQVGVGAVIFNDLVNDRVKNVDFDWDKAVSFDGDSGPYVQYSQVRCQSLLNKYEKDLQVAFVSDLKEKEERELVKTLINYDQALSNSFKHFKPHILAAYLLDVCKSFNHFYHKCRILGEAEGVEQSRISLVYATSRVLQEGLAVLGIASPKAM